MSKGRHGYRHGFPSDKNAEDQVIGDSYPQVIDPSHKPIQPLLRRYLICQRLDMASSTSFSFQQALEQVVQAHTVLQKHADPHVNGVQSVPGFPKQLEHSRKNLANAAAYLLQASTDPREYLEQLAAHVSPTCFAVA